MKFKIINASSKDWYNKFNELVCDEDDESFKCIFEHLIDGISLDMFLKDIFEKTPCLFQRTESSNNNILLDIITKSSFIQFIRSFDNGIVAENNITVVRYVDEEREDLDWKIFHNQLKSKKRKNYEHNNEDSINLVKSNDIEKIFNEKYTIQYYQPQRYFDILYKTNCSFEYHFGTLAGSSTYFTPGNSQGLPPHHDDVDVFILQTEGEKDWYIWNGKIELPETYQRISREDLPKDCKKVTLRKGELLYLPRGTIHEAIALNSFSTHVTISVYQNYNMKALLSRVVLKTLEKASSVDVNIRKGLPIKLRDSFGTFAARLSGQQNLSLRNEILSKSKEIVKNLNNFVTIETIDEACDEIAVDFIQNRLPLPVIPIHTSSKKSKKISSTSMVRLIEPTSSIHFAIQEIAGLSVLCIANSLNNNRLTHMGHPLEYGDNDDDNDIDESSLRDLDDVSSIWQITIPSRLTPILICLMQSSPNLMKISEIIKLMKISQIHESEVLETINKLHKEEIIYVD